ncbi:hypothetical protein BDY19DRAFT_992220 [Irpex rosettiformis]|uniref:Uncharacterized protein n=1 Tax=Irpex rosettiformis TaxID=378272 RepID=A0ACB8U957_9APHY|nr:hypothetical protein BDY19DRAFT_992220 [Irpex rosettiformis]
MSARRQASTTSLSKYARAHSPDFSDNSLDFCNAFWGSGDVGVEVLFARMRGALRTTEELRNFWKERAVIEEQYAKKLAGLAKMAVGRDEVGELRTSLDTLRSETEKQASYHLNLAQQVKNEIESSTSVYLNRQLHHKKSQQAAVEREFKLKQQQEAHVNRAREKYEADCMRINSYTAQATLMQGKELENIQAKLKRAQATVGANEQDFQKFTRILQETTSKWEQDWKTFCDSCQDMEEERMDFVKDTLWTYANAVSTVCVNDDEACETMRCGLEQFEPVRDMASFVRTYSTGNAIPDPPHFINYADPNAAVQQRPTSRPAQFQRVTERAPPMLSSPAPEEPQPDSELENTAGVGAGSNAANIPPRARSASRASTRGDQRASATVPATNGRNGVSRTSDPLAAPTEKTMLKVGNRAYGVDPNDDPQSRSGSQLAGASNGAPSNVGDEEADPLARQMLELQRSATRKGSQGSQQPPRGQAPSPAQAPSMQRPTHSSQDSSSNLSPPPGGRGGGPPNKVDYRRSAEIVVGLPPNVTGSRPASPNPPAPVLSRPPSSAAHDDSVQDMLNNYQQSLPGEHKTVSRSRASSYSNQNVPPPTNNQPPSGRAETMAGVGAQGRSPSPQPFRPPSRAASPNPQRGVSPNASSAASPARNTQQWQQGAPQSRRDSFRGPPISAVSAATPLGNGFSRPGHSSISVPTQPIQRAPSPNHVGIALDPSGRVAHDEMAERYNNSRNMYQPPPSTAPPPPPQQPPYQPPTQQGPQRSPSYPPPNQPGYGQPPPVTAAPYGRTQQGFGQQAPPPQQPPAPGPQQPQPYGAQQYGNYPAQPDYNQTNGVQRNGSYNAPQGYYQQQQQQPQYSQPAVNRAPSPQPEPQPQQLSQMPSPTGAYTDDGRPVLFYVTAMYDYQASIPEEFDFQTNDVIAVTATPEDGWWSGELLDEARRQPGRHVFPSNFVQLF